MKRITLTARHGEFQAGVDVELEDEQAADLIKRGKATLAKQQVIYSHEDEMSPSVKEASQRALDAANAAGDFKEQQVRAQATAGFRK